MKRIKIIISIFSIILLLASCNNHPCVGTWKASFTRHNRNDVREEWLFKIKSDGTCYAHEKGSGAAKYEEEYEGTWKEVSSDVIFMDMCSDMKDRDVVSYDVIASGYKHKERSKRSISYYLRSDGGISTSRDFSYIQINAQK